MDVGAVVDDMVNHNNLTNFITIIATLRSRHLNQTFLKSALNYIIHLDTCSSPSMDE